MYRVVYKYLFEIPSQDMPKKLWKVKKIYKEGELFLFNYLLLFFVAIFRNNLQGPEARKYSTR
jgi:hypothetical protein